jgi:hypothetical protein
MTFNEAVAKVEAEIDRFLEARIRRQAARMFEDGCSAEEINLVAALQRQRDRPWRAAALCELRGELCREYGLIVSLPPRTG